MSGFGTNGTRVAVITGASKGLGFTLANFLGARGYKVIITGRDTERLMAAADQLRAGGAAVEAVSGDIGNALHRDRLGKVVADFGGLDILINNASTVGPLPMPYLATYNLEELRGVFEVNTLAPLALVQALRPYLAASQGLVVNISSDAASGGYESWGGYGASKAALDLISLTLANELKEEGIGVVSVDPGDMRTDMHQDAFPGEDISDRPLPEVTVPFWAWLFGQDPAVVTGQRYQAQSELWLVPA
jgi:NAD(P)-dependent dehydrogenase (short-subunit alcohol dehydrogenase family)